MPDGRMRVRPALEWDWQIASGDPRGWSRIARCRIAVVFPRGLQLRVAILPHMTHKTLRRTLIHGYCGEFRVETMESQAPGQTQWSSTAFVYHRDHPSPIATIEGAGQGEYRGDAREQALRVGSCLAEFLDPKEYRA